MTRPADGGGYSALVVDDSQLTRLIICRELTSLGFTVTQVEHGGKALEAIGARQPAFVRFFEVLSRHFSAS